MSEHELIENLEKKPELRARFRREPDKVVEEHEITLNDDQRKRLKAEDWSSMSDDDLVSRVRGNSTSRILF